MRLSEKGNSVTMEIQIWLAKDGAIHMTGPLGASFHVAIRPDAVHSTSPPYLFQELAKCLKQMGAPAPEISN
jgi:hypothetical protein